MATEIKLINWGQINVTASTTKIDEDQAGKILLSFGKPGRDEVTGYVLTKSNAKYLINRLKAAIELAD